MRAILASTLALMLLPFLAAAPASAHVATCSADDVVCIAECHAGHTDVGVHECRIVWPFVQEAGAATAMPCYGNPAAVLVCWTGTDPGCFYFTVAGERAYWLDFCY